MPHANRCSSKSTSSTICPPWTFGTAWDRDGAFDEPLIERFEEPPQFTGRSLGEALHREIEELAAVRRFAAVAAVPHAARASLSDGAVHEAFPSDEGSGDTAVVELRIAHFEPHDGGLEGA